MLKDRFIKFFVIQKFRFDIAIQFLVFANFAVNVVGASDKIQLFLSKTFELNLDLYVITVFGIILSFFVAWLLGYTLDNLRYWQSIRTVQTDRDPLMDKLNKLEEEIVWLKNQLIKNTKV